MRPMAAVLVTLCWLMATPAFAQRAQLLSGGINRTEIINTPIDTSRVVGSQQPMLPSFNLLNFFPNLHNPLGGSTHGVSPLPPPSAFPSSHYPSVLKPVPPIYPAPRGR